MEGLSSLEMLQPETQSLIMCYLPSVTSLHSLLRASPRFYQVFRSRRGYHLTQLAIQYSWAPADAWDSVRASKLPKPCSHYDVEAFTQTFQDDEGYKAPILPIEISIPMIKLNSCVEWFISDFARDSLSNLSCLSKFINLQQDRDAVQSKLSNIEKGRISRAFCRFETFRNLFAPAYEEESDIDKLQPGVDFLNKYNVDEIEEIACVRDYIVRQLWCIFDKIEDDLVQGKLPEPLQKAAQDLDEDFEPLKWFSQDRKSCHTSYMENLMTFGLAYLKDILTADPARRAELVLEKSTCIGGFLSDTIPLVHNDEPRDWRPSPVYFPTSYHETLNEASIGWHWIVLRAGQINPGTYLSKGPRDWGYIFWDRKRMTASRVISDL